MRVNAHLKKVDTLWKKALPYFQERGHVIFVSPGLRFWDRHGFVQQSLAHLLVENGVRVTWLDGAGWRSYHPRYPRQLSLLRVEQLFELPGRRFPFVDRLNDGFVARKVNGLIAQSSKPIVWIWGGVRESIAKRLRYIDVFSVFDDPGAVKPRGELCRRAKVITCQNPFALKLFQEVHKEKTYLLFPPVELNESAFAKNAEFKLPEGFPKEVMGYIGSLPFKGFDFILFENFIQSFPEKGFLLVGPADGEALKWIVKFKKYRNFHYSSWIDRSQIQAAWKTLSVSLLLYRPAFANDGAFPVKALEGLHFNVPSVATEVPKTSGIEGFIPRSSFPDKLKALALSAIGQPEEKLDDAYDYFSFEMDPKIHLSRIAGWLSL